MNFEIKNTNLVLNRAMSQVWKIKKYSYENVVRPDYGLLYLFSGNITYTFEDTRIELNPGDVIYLPKNSNYTVEFDLKNGVVEDYLINFDVVGSREFTDTDKPTCILNDYAGNLFDYFKDVVNSSYEKDKALLTNSYFYMCLNFLQTAIKYKNGDEDRLKFEKAAKKLVKEPKISVDDISRELHMSRSAFQKKFIQYFDMSPIEYRTEKRLKKAKMLLETTDIPIKEIADLLGLYDTAYFYKIFKKAYSVTPGQYRETLNPVF